MAGRGFSLGAALVALALWSGVALAAEAPTRAEYVERAEPLCATAAERTDPLFSTVRVDIKHERVRPAGHALHRAAQSIATLNQALRRIPKPSADAKTLTTWLGHLEDQTALAAKAGTLLSEDRRTKVAGYLSRLIHAGNLANDTVLGFGFNKCLFHLGKLPKV
jgi:hypothetical protein